MTIALSTRIQFVHSPEIYYQQNYGARFTPLWAYTLAAYVPSHWELGIFDCSVEDRFNIAEADIFAFSGINQDFNAIKSTHQQLKELYPQAIFILGGPITWSYEQDNRLNELAYFDYLFILDGEKALPDFLEQYEQGEHFKLEKIIRGSRVPVDQAKKLRVDLLAPQASKYYGGVIEVSRGCPFLCEFCDIRVLPNNNEAHNKNIELIVEELDAYYQMGIRQIQLACDNFIGNISWARACVAAIVDWVERTGSRVALYTWVTVNFAKLPDLMRHMRQAGFTSVFIGVESFNANSILETAKIQNKNDHKQMEEALQTIHSFGFIIAPGLIFGFDNDRPSLFDDTLNGTINSGLIAGDPTFLIALPGTPLYSRMKRTQRLVEYDQTDETLALENERVSKIQSNIKYIQPREFLIDGFIRFMKAFTSPELTYQRFSQHVRLMMESENFVPIHAVGYGSLPEYLKFQFSSTLNLKMLMTRFSHLLKPGNFWAILKAYRLVRRYRSRYPGLKNHFTFWVFTWSNLLIKYDKIKPEDFKIYSLEDGFDMATIWRDVDYREPDLLSNGRNSDNVKVADQAQRTREALLTLEKNLEETTYQLSDFRP